MSINNLNLHINKSAYDGIPFHKKEEMKEEKKITPEIDYLIEDLIEDMIHYPIE